MNTERDKFLTEAMGGVWLQTLNMGMVKSPSCKESTTTDFSTWAGFGKLWTWAQQQEWWKSFSAYLFGWGDLSIINPDRFANAVYDFLKTKGE